MKPPPFELHTPTTTTQALEILAEYHYEAKILAGGQTLVPAMNFRLARSEHIVDINGIPELDFIHETEDRLCFGALKRHVDFQTPVTNDPLGALLAEVCSHIAHYPIRCRGTFAGSLSHADPSSEWCLVAQTLGAELVVESLGGTRVIPAESYFKSALMTDLEPTEILKEVRLPLLGPSAKFGFSEYSRRVGDFALAMILCVLWMEDDKIIDARIGVGGACGIPTRIYRAEEILKTLSCDPQTFEQASLATSEDAKIIGDHLGSADYRRDLVNALTMRALQAAIS